MDETCLRRAPARYTGRQLRGRPGPPTSVQRTRPTSSQSEQTACSCPGSTAPRARPSTHACGSKTQTSAGAPTASVPASTPSDVAPARCVIACERRRTTAMPVLVRPLERQRQQQLEAGGAGLRLAERHLLRRRRRPARGPSRRRRSCRPPRPPAARRGRACRAAAASGCACASNQPMSTSHRCRWWTPTSHVTGRPSAFAARTIATPSADDSRHRWTRTPVSRTSARIVDSAIVSAMRRDRGQAEARRDLAFVRDAAAREVARPAAAATRDGRTSRAYCIARSSTCVSASGASACENATQPASRELAHLGQLARRQAAASARRPDTRAPG